MNDDIKGVVADITRDYMDYVGLAVRPFVDELNEPLLNKKIPGFSHQTIHNWLSGKSVPSDKVNVLQMCSESGMWQYEFACELLEATNTL